MVNIYKIKGKMFALRGKLVKMDARDPFTIKINTALGNGFNRFTLPLTNHATNIKVSTSDGQSFTITDYLDIARTINFASAGIYTIELRGYCGWAFNNTGDCQKVIGVTRWGSSFKFSYLVGGFRGCINLGLNEGLPKTGYILATTTTISLQNIFTSCNLVDFGHDDLFHKIKITSLQDAFVGCKFTYFGNRVLQNQIHITTITRMCSNMATLTDMHNDALSYLIRCNFATGSFVGCNFSILRAGWLVNMTNLTRLYSTFSNNRISVIEDGAFDSQINVTDMSGILALNEIASLPNRLFYNCKKVTSYNGTLRDQRVPMSLPAEIWDLSVISIVTNWNLVLQATNTTLSPKGTVQPIWNYASPTATKTDALNNCTALTNYDDSPLEWR